MSLFVPEQVQQVLCEQPILGAQSHLCFLLGTDKPPISLPIYQAQPLLSASPQPTSSGEGWSTPVNFRQNPDTPEMPYFPFLFFIGQVSVPIPLAELSFHHRRGGNKNSVHKHSLTHAGRKHA